MAPATASTASAPCAPAPGPGIAHVHDDRVERMVAPIPARGGAGGWHDHCDGLRCRRPKRVAVNQALLGYDFGRGASRLVSTRPFATVAI